MAQAGVYQDNTDMVLWDEEYCFKMRYCCIRNPEAMRQYGEPMKTCFVISDAVKVFKE